MNHWKDKQAHDEWVATPKPEATQAGKQKETGWTIGELFLAAILMVAAAGVWAAYGDEVMKWWDAGTEASAASPD